MQKFPKIGHFREAFKTAKKRGYANLRYRGTVKLHGTHCDIVRHPDGEIRFQSRNNVVCGEYEVCGLVKFCQGVDWQPLFDKVQERTGHDGIIVLSGEFCGRNIQRGVALEQLEKFIMLYAVWLVNGDEKIWLDMTDYQDLKVPEMRVFNIMDYPTWEIIVNTSNPTTTIEQMEDLTMQVENECPVSKALGAVGLGEGIVWVCLSDPDPELTFKTKGDKHKVVNTKKLIEVDPEIIHMSTEFVERTVSENRLRQGLDYLSEQGLEHGRASTGQFVKWVLEDVMKEEGDLLDPKCFKNTQKMIKKEASKWFLTQV